MKHTGYRRHRILDITMTATRRPEVLERTLKSFKELMWDGWPLGIHFIVNVDPVGHDMDSMIVVDLCREYFPNITFRCPKEPSFPSAFRWCWEHATAPFVFHLEDDWELLRKIDPQEMLDLMERNPDLMVLRLPFSPLKDTNKSWNHFLPWNGEFYEVPLEDRGLLGFSGHPSMIRSKFVGIAIQMLDGRNNPEKQLKWKPYGTGKELMDLRYGVFGSPGEPPAVKDIGARWKPENGWKKQGNKSHFVRWCRIGEPD